jgi:tetratricopeptide (TPR) repeat protein
MSLASTPFSQKIMKRISTILLAAALSQSVVTAQEINSYWTEYGREPVIIQQNNNGAKQNLKFVDFKDNMLVAELAGGVGEVSLPVSQSMVQTLKLDNSVMSEVNRLLEQGNLEGALIKLRPFAYPLIKFYEVPESFTQLHIPIRTLVETLIRAKEYSEAEDVLQRLELNKLSLKYSELAIDLMNAYLEDEAFDAAAKITEILPVDGQYAANIRPIIDAADALRAAGKYEAVIPLYREIEKVVPDAVKKNVQMWLAYSLVLANRLDEAAPIIEKLEEPAPNERLFSLYKLLEGSREHRNQNYNKALDLLTRGFVRAQTSYVWVPEMLYLIGDCYALTENTLAARNVWTEIVILYPESPWAESAETSLSQLPEPEPPTAE